MADRPKMMPIKLMKAHCSSFPRRTCWSAGNPYYSGHYQTKLGALTAARKMRKQLAVKWAART